MPINMAKLRINENNTKKFGKFLLEIPPQTASQEQCTPGIHVVFLFDNHLIRSLESTYHISSLYSDAEMPSNHVIHISGEMKAQSALLMKVLDGITVVSYTETNVVKPVTLVSKDFRPACCGTDIIHAVVA